MVKLFHGTLIGGITAFNCMSHFGTESSALAAAAAKVFERKKTSPFPDAYLYEVELNISNLKVMKLEDFGGMSPAHLITFILDSGHQFLTGHMKHEIADLKDNYIELKHKHQLTPAYVESTFKKIGHSLGIDVFEYENAVEDKASISYAVIDSTNVIIKKHRLITDEEIFQGRDNLSDCRKIILGIK